VNTEYSYEPYGKPTTTGSSTTNPFAFTGLVWDGESGLYDNRFRQLNPTIARFGSEDRIDVLGGWNLYGYAGNSPSVLTDGLGLDPAFNVPPWLVDTLNWVAFGLGIASFFYPPLAPLATGVSWLSAGLVCANGQGDCTTSLVYAAASTAFVGIGLLPAIARGGIATFIARVAGGWGLVNLEAQSVGAWNPPK
jgi:RHS repeat-associated protein